MHDQILSDKFTLKKMEEQNTEDVVDIISKAMNADEGRWALKTIKFHFFCQKHGIDDGRKYFLLFDDKRIVGISGLHNYEWGPEDIAWLGWFAVSPNYQGQRLGFILMQKTLEIARNLKFRKLFIETYSNEDFSRARKFYEKVGFETAGKIDGYINNKTSMVVYSLDLN